MNVAITVNGQVQNVEVAANTLLVNVLREQLGLTGTHVGCDTSQCGACTVHLDGRAVKSCSVLAVQAQGAQVVTIEGIGSTDDLVDVFLRLPPTRQFRFRAVTLCSSRRPHVLKRRHDADSKHEAALGCAFGSD